MRLTRLRFTVRLMMIAVAIIALLFGCFAGVRTKWKSDEYRVMARKFADQVVYETEMERLLRQAARASAESAKKLAKEASDNGRPFKRGGPAGGIDPGIFGPTSPSSTSSDLTEILTGFGMRQAFREAHTASENLDQAELAEKRAKHFANLEKKYQRAARYPWFSIAPDPPEPK